MTEATRRILYLLFVCGLGSSAIYQVMCDARCITKELASPAPAEDCHHGTSAEPESPASDRPHSQHSKESCPDLSHTTNGIILKIAAGFQPESIPLHSHFSPVLSLFPLDLLARDALESHASSPPGPAQTPFVESSTKPILRV
jgi:hypothetical protein